MSIELAYAAVVVGLALILVGRYLRGAFPFGGDAE